MPEILQITPPGMQDVRVVKLKGMLMNTVSQEMQKHPLPQQQNRQTVRQWLTEALERTGVEIPADVCEHILESAVADLIGYGPLELLLSDPQTSEIMVNGAKQVFIERNGELLETDVSFQDDEHVMRIINRIVNPLGRSVDADNPTADARLPDGSRVNVAIPPIAVDGPTITIRKFLETKMTLDDLIEFGSLTPYMAKFLEACVKARLNILITGNTSSGKTTMLKPALWFHP
jgi:pilus assembly protein CpaF